MQAYLINLARRPDRLSQMTAQLARLQIPVQIVSAVDAREISDELANQSFTSDGPLGPLPKGDKCCTLSHMRAWNTFLTSGDSHGLILEDDVALDPDAADMLRSSAWIPPEVGLLKIEHFGPHNQRVLLDKLTATANGRQIGRLLSRHTGAAAYIVTRETARMLLSRTELWSLPVDHMLFNLNNSPLAMQLRPYQLTPAVARQSEAIGGKTDIGEWRVHMRNLSLRYLKRELVRAYYELRLLPSQIASFVRRDANLVRVEAPSRTTQQR